ncbi:DNA-directed RNA polymerase subunit beta' [Patescibacteria group bacterium]|nr:DNA-directed RNA polymerase subunit beta' [Patescibacteria group bacterium]
MENQRVQDFEAIVLKLASPEDILSWSHGEVTKPETINYRSQKPEKDGLFDERIFGPTKDYECYCGKYRRIRYKGIICDKCGVEVTRAVVRRERMGHIKLASPVSHIWFLRGVPSKIGLLLDMSVVNLEKVIYFGGYIITNIDDAKRTEALEEIEREFKSKSSKMTKSELSELKDGKEIAKEELKSLRMLRVLSEVEYHRLSMKYGEVFEAGIGAEVLKHILERVDMQALRSQLEHEIENSEAIQKKKLLKRLRVVKSMMQAGLRPDWMFLTVVPVIPPDLRPMVPLDGGRYATADLNDLYRRVINRNNRLKRLYELKAPEVITRNEKRMLQEAVDALIDNSARRGQAPVASQAQRRPLKSLADMLKGKQGRFRQNLLGKRVDYSGRSVIVVGPTLRLDQCGLPKEMALELFKPFVIRKLIELELAHNMRGAARLIEERPPEVWAILDDVIEGKYVLLNRAPTLHRLGIQAFQPVLIEGHAIQIHPLVTTAFNADFDGDQMAVHLPLTDEAQAEAREIMRPSINLLKPATGGPIVRPTQDMVLGCYWVTTLAEDAEVAGEGKVFPTPEDAMLAYEFGHIDLRARIKVRISSGVAPQGDYAEKAVSIKKTKKAKKEEEPVGTKHLPSALLETSVGRILFNRVLPEDYEFVNKDMKAADLEELVENVIKQYGMREAPRILDNIKKFGFEYATRSGISWGMDDLRTPQEKFELVRKADEEVTTINDQYQRGLLTDKERYDRVVGVWTKVVEEVRALVPNTLERFGPIYMMINSKARGSWLNTSQMAGMKGLVVNPAGKQIELPIISSYKEGLNVLEYFISTHGARKGTADTALKTAVAGYLTRRLVDVSQDVMITENDCKTDDGITLWRKDSVEIGRPFASRVYSRTALETIKRPDTEEVIVETGEIITKEKAKIIGGIETIESMWVRSPMSCKSIRGICQKCYGLDLGRNELIHLGEAVGIVAAQSIGEPGTQLTMRTFHTGGVAAGGDITSGLPRVEEIFEVRTPKGRAVITDVPGTVTDIHDEHREKVITIFVDQDMLKTIEESSEKKKRGKKSKEPKLEEKEKTFRVPPGIGLAVEVGARVLAGDLLSEGHADLKELFKIGGKELIERYIIKEVQKIYSLQGAPIHDKHIEVIVRQMFSRVRIKEAGDTGFTEGELIEKLRFRQENRRAEKEGLAPATAHQVLLGITKVALSTNSFLSAASFMETARVLINAAIEGKEDPLRGLKENVIIGRLIPSGRGYRK